MSACAEIVTSVTELLTERLGGSLMAVAAPHEDTLRFDVAPGAIRLLVPAPRRRDLP